MDHDQYVGYIGRKLRETRKSREMSVTATAQLAGMSIGHLSRIERGERPVTSRATLEALARALKVQPVALTGKPYTPTDVVSIETHAAMSAIEDALTGWWVGEIPYAPTRPWPDVQADIDRIDTLRRNSDYATHAALLPDLIRDILAAVAIPQHRRAALLGLLAAYRAAGTVAGALGFPGIRFLAGERLRQAAEELGDPEQCDLVAWRRAHTLSSTNRPRQYELAVAVADNANRMEVRGMANLTAALASAAQGREEDAQEHLAEAATLAETIDADVSPWGYGLEFGRTNVGIWRVAIGVELGYGAKVAELASKVRPETISPSRQATFWTDYGRGLITERKTRERGLQALLRAEDLAPQQVRNNAFVHEAVADLMGRARREAGGRELRGFARRLGIAPNG